MNTSKEEGERPVFKMPTYEDVLQAEKAIKGKVHRTRILTSNALNDQLTQLAHEH